MTINGRLAQPAQQRELRGSQKGIWGHPLLLPMHRAVISMRWGTDSHRTPAAGGAEPVCILLRCLFPQQRDAGACCGEGIRLGTQGVTWKPELCTYDTGRSSVVGVL